MMEKRDLLMPLREFSSVKVGDQLPEKTYPLTRQDLVNYAGVSGDLNPIHWDDEIAKVVGLDTAIAHGMLTMGLGGGYVTSWVGDPGAVTEYNVRFTAVVPVPNDGKGAEIVFDTRRQRGKERCDIRPLIRTIGSRRAALDKMRFGHRSDSMNSASDGRQWSRKRATKRGES